MTFTEVPPPKKAPVHEIAETLGLCAGLRAERRDRQYRCKNCGQMQPQGSWQIWIPDGVRASDPEWSVTEACRLRAYNGNFSAWCLNCAQKFRKAKAEPTQSVESKGPPKAWWQFWRKGKRR